MCNLDIDSIFTDITNEEPIQVCLNVLIKNDQIVHVSRKMNWKVRNDKTKIILPTPFISESCIKIKINLNFIFTLLCGASKGFRKAFKAFIKPFEAPERSVQIKI